MCIFLAYKKNHKLLVFFSWDVFRQDVPYSVVTDLPLSVVLHKLLHTFSSFALLLLKASEFVSPPLIFSSSFLPMVSLSWGQGIENAFACLFFRKYHLTSYDG